MQSCWVYCPKCNNELTASKENFVKDTDLVYYKCCKCGHESKWDFDAPTPLLIPWIDKVAVGDAVLYLGDSYQIIPTLDLPKDTGILTDPPYGINNDTNYTRFDKYMGKWNSGRKYIPHNNDDIIVGDDKGFDPELFLNFPEVILWGANHYIRELPCGAWLVWIKKPETMWCNKILSDAEMAWMNRGSSIYLYKEIWNGAYKENENFTPVLHPNQKPIALMDWCLTFMKKSGTILDPFMGTGCVGIAALKAGKRYIGIECDEKYFKIACDRIAKEANQLKLFEAVKV